MNSTIFAVGDTVRAYDIPSFPQYEGSVVTITSVDREIDGRIYYNAEFTSQQKPDDSIALAFYRAESIRDGETLSVSNIAPPLYTQGEMDEKQSVIDRLTRERDDYRQQVATGKSTHEDLGRRLLDQAVTRGWCSEFDEFVSDYNGDCPSGWEIPERVKLVEKRVRVKGEVYRDITVWVKEDEDETDPDNWYSSNDTDSAMVDPQEFIEEQLDEEKDENGWDDTSVRSLY